MQLECKIIWIDDAKIENSENDAIAADNKIKDVQVNAIWQKRFVKKMTKKMQQK